MRGRLQPSVWTDRRGVSEVIGAVILLGFLMLTLTLYQTQVVPIQNSQTEYEHQQTVHEDLVEFRNAVFTAATQDEPRTASVQLGMEYESGLFAINPPPAAGRIQTSQPYNMSFQNQRTCRVDEVPTRFVEYQPAYTELRSGSVWYENSIVYQDDRDRAGISVIEDQNIVIEGRPIRPVAVQNELRESETETETFELHLDADAQLDPAVFATDPKRVSITTPTRLNGSEYWDEAFTDRIQHTITDGEYASGVHALELFTPEAIEFDTVGIGSTPDESPARYPPTVDREFSDPNANAPSDLVAVLSGMNGSGNESAPYVITDSHELQAMNANRSANYTLGTNINASGTETWNGGDGFDPVGECSLSGMDCTGDGFNGSFDGNGYVVSELTVDRGHSGVGLFGYVDNGRITDVGVESANITAGGRFVGGLVGYSQDARTNRSYTTGTVTGPSGRQDTGGLVGFTDGSGVTSSYSTANVTGGARVGGLVGSATGNSNVSGSYASGAVEGAGDDVGGLVGFAEDSDVNRSFATGAIAGSTNVGGLVGEVEEATGDSEIQQSYATGAVDGTENVGGLVGRNNGDVQRTYATGAVSIGGSGDVGGLLGVNVVPPGPPGLSDSYWDRGTTNQNNAVGDGPRGPRVSGFGSVDDIEPAPRMQGRSADDPGNMSEFDFDSNWRTLEHPEGYPMLQCPS